MRPLLLTIYLIFLVIILEIIKMIKRELRKSIMLYVIQLIVLIFSFLIIAIFAINKIFALVPVLIAIAVTIDWIKSKKLRITTLELTIFFYFIMLLTGLILIFYGMVKA